MSENDSLPASAAEPLTVAALVQQPALRGSRVLAGAPTTSRMVTWCLPWTEVTRGHAAVDGVAVHAHVDDLLVEQAPTTVSSLAERGAAALLISGDAARLPTGLVATLGTFLPVVQLPAAVGFPLANRTVAEHAFAQTVQVLEFGITVHRTLAELLHRGAGLPALGRQLAALSRSPAFILDPQGKVLVYEYLGAAGVPDPFEVVRLLCELNLVGQPASERRGASQVKVVELALEDELVTCLIGPIVLGYKHLGSLVVVELDSRPSEHDLAQHRVIVEQAATIAGTELLRLRSVEEAMERARGDFVHALLHGRFANPHDLPTRAAHHGFDVNARYGVVAAHPRPGNPPASAPSLRRRAEQILRRDGVQTLAVTVDDLLVVIRQVVDGPGSRHDATNGAAQVAEYATALAQELHGLFGAQPTVTYGRPAGNARAIPTSYREARIALGVCQRLGTRKVAGYSELRVFAALADIASTPQGRGFAEEVLAPLRRGDSTSDLERAVIAYLDAGGNLNAAARRLQLHRNTMLYKLDRAARLLGLDLREPDNQFTLALAHRIRLLGDVQEGIDRDFAQPNPS